MEDYHRLSVYFYEVSLRSEDIHLLSPPSPSSSSPSPAEVSFRFFRCATGYIFDAEDQSLEGNLDNLPVILPDLRVDSEMVETTNEEFYRCVAQSLEQLELDEGTLPIIADGIITQTCCLKREHSVAHSNFRVLPLSVKITRVDFLSLSEFSTDRETRINASIVEVGEADDAIGEAHLEIGEEHHRMVPASEKSIKTMLKRVTVTGIEVPEESTGDECAGGCKRRRISRNRKAETCMICLEDMRVGSRAMQVPCSHVFHSKCAKDWLRASHFCPLCRFEFPVDDPI